ncbi:hypothetical protein MKQ68_10685 [Chitinophaga horti]|uniref:Uncharacterized protein n=1 Tax=Chitinophaga horti TaxID=2920382 RepID=A0ABY6JB12_9BACT|nr:hypothetical protein [Chitinophaga horti]UYQ95567.1 hypothetical protein MKQ68_10685 [Chitinophaga horti]
MKRTLTTLLGILFTFTLFAQAKPDVIIKLNGDEMKGKVLEMNEDAVKFTYTGETLVYNIKKSEILKITFASGREEIITKPGNTAVAATPAVAPEDHRNKIAILPFALIRDGQSVADQLSERAQGECYGMLSKHAGLNTILDPRTTNALLLKAGITPDNIKAHTMDDICNILGVEYVVNAVVTVDKTTQTSYSSSSGSSTTKTDSKNPNKTNDRYSGSTYATNTQAYKSVVLLNVYNDQGASVFSQERQSFFNTDDAYKNALEYLLKRTPIYHK